MNNRTTISCLLIVAFLGSAGCSSSRRPGFPPQSYDEKQLIIDLEKRFKIPERIGAYYEAQKMVPANDTTNPNSTSMRALKALRDQIITSRLTLINLHYNQFVADASFNRQVMDFSADIADLGVDLAATVVGSAGTKTILSAISGGITGSQASIHKNFFLDKTVSAIVSTMNASRKSALIPIAKGRLLPVDEYPLGQALSDLDQYYFAGTFLGALQTIEANAGEKGADADEKLADIRGVGAVTTTAMIDKKSAMTDVIGRLAENPLASLEQVNAILAALDIEPGADAATALTKLQRAVREARTESEIDRVHEAFRAANAFGE